MPAITLHPADRYDPAALGDLFNRCFAGYFAPAHLDAAALAALTSVFDVDLGASRVAESEAGAVAFAFLAIRAGRAGSAGWGSPPRLAGAAWAA